jgi:hypothetical protein
MAAVSRRVAARVRRDFAPADVEHVLRLLESLQAEKQAAERYQGAVVILARGELERAEWAASIDWRDAFVWSGMGGNWYPVLDREFGVDKD